MSCSERCSRGLRCASSASGVSKFAGSWLASAGGALSWGTFSVKRYHQAMSCGLTKETVVHHGAVAPGFAEPLGELRGDFGVDRGALARRAVGRGVGAAAEPVLLQRRVGVGVQVPLAPPARLVAALAQQRAPGRKAGVELAVAGDQAAGLVGVEARHERAARGRAVVGGRVVAFEVDGPVAQRGQVRHQRRRRDAQRASTPACAAGRRGSRGCSAASRRALGVAVRRVLGRAPRARRRHPCRPRLRARGRRRRVGPA